MARILLSALAVLVLGWPAVAEAKTASTKTVFAKTAFNGAGLRKCVRVVRHASGDMLENGCASCRLISVQRARPGGVKPTSQTLTVPKRTRQPLPFRGPGHTRITADRPCPGAAPEPLRADAGSAAGSTAGSGRKCVRLLKTRTGGAALINPCQVCRTVKVEFVDNAGNRTHRAFAIAPHSPLSFPSVGLAKARILMDGPCG